MSADHNANSSDPDSHIPRGAGYRLTERIGAGRTGEVWKAEAPNGELVAIKISLRPINHEEVRRELQALETIRKLRHPNLLKLQAYFPVQDRLLIVMELADGSLRDNLKTFHNEGRPGQSFNELHGYFREAAAALDYLRSENVMHGDLKPDNLLLVGNHVRIADFGRARVLSTRPSGTPAYMAPEVWRNTLHCNSDQYSLAVSYIELRLGRLLFALPYKMSLMIDQLQKKPDLSPLARPEQQVLLKALAKNPLERFESCSSFIHALSISVGMG